MKQSDEIIKRQRTQIRFHNRDMEFIFNWFIGAGALVGLSHAELFNLVDGMKDGDPAQWRDRFGQHGEFLVARSQKGAGATAAQDRLAGTFCYRAALQYSDPTTKAFARTVGRMDAEFLEGCNGLGRPLRPIEVPFEGASPPGYCLEHDGAPRPVLSIVGGGDTLREDLF